MGWEREAEFKQLLVKCCNKASRSAIDSLAQIAVEDHNLVSLHLLTPGTSSSFAVMPLV